MHGNALVVGEFDNLGDVDEVVGKGSVARLIRGSLLKILFLFGVLLL